MIEVRGSEVQDFLRCRLRWKYRWVDQLVSKRPNNKLFFGTKMHQYLEALYNDSAWRVKDAILCCDDPEAMEMDPVEINELKELLVYVAANYVKTYYKRDKERFETIATELQFKIPLDAEIVYTGTIDLVLKDRTTGEIWFMDHKTTDSIQKYEKNAIMDRQISRYWWALQQLSQGKGTILIGDQWLLPRNHLDLRGNIGGFLYNIILKDYPQPPKVLKNGKLSTAKNQNTTYELYIQTLREQGLMLTGQFDADGTMFETTPFEYDDYLDYLRNNPREYFKRVEVLRNQDEIDASIQEFYYTAAEIVKTRGYVEQSEISHTYRNITQDCSWDCSFKDVCIAGFNGSDVNYLLDVLYTKEEKQ